MHSLEKQGLGTYYMPGHVRGTGDMDDEDKVAAHRILGSGEGDK